MDYHENSRGSAFAVRIHEDPQYQNSELPRNIDVNIPTRKTVHLLRDDAGVSNAPERALTIFAMRLAILERIATGVGALSFIWATVVILGGYAVALREDDFWFVTIILFIEGARIFSRSHELEWQRHDNMNLGETLFVTYQSLGHAFSSLVFSSVHEAMNAYRSQQAYADQLPEARQESIDIPANNNGNSTCSSTTSTKTRNVNYYDVKPEPAAAARESSPSSSSSSNSNSSGRGELELEPPPAAFRIRRAWSIPHAPFLPFMTTFFKAQYVSLYFYCLQVLSALVSFALSLWRLIYHNFNRPGELDADTNHTAALFIFYSLTLIEVAVFLVEKAYWQYEVSANRIMETAHKKCRLEEHDKELYTTKRFFYDVLQKCLNESVFEGLKMDMVGYALQWIHSDEQKEQLYGVKALYACAMKQQQQQQGGGEGANSKGGEETLRVIGRRQGAVERLIEMVTWKNDEESRVREAAAELVAKLVEYDVAINYVRLLASTSGCIQAIFTLLLPPQQQQQHPRRRLDDDEDDFKFQDDDDDEEEEENEENKLFSCSQLPQSLIPSPPLSQQQQQQQQRFVLLGLDIFIHLSRRHHINRSKIGNTPLLLPTLLSFIDISPFLPPTTAATTIHNNIPDHLDDTPAILVVEKSLQLLCHLAACHGIAGRKLRQAIAREVVCLGHLSRILQLEEGVARRRRSGRRLRLLAAEVVSRLAMEEAGREAIGRTGGMMGSLVRLFVGGGGGGGGQGRDDDEKVAAMAGSALARLTVVGEEAEGSTTTSSRRNCERLLMEREVEVVVVEEQGGGGGVKLVEALERVMDHPSKGKLALAILRSLWENNNNNNNNMMHMHIMEEDSEEENQKRSSTTTTTLTTRLAMLLPRVLSLAMDPPNSSEAIMEEAIGFVATMLGSMTETGGTDWEVGIAPNRIVEMIMSILAKHLEPSTRVPRMRRSCLELVLALTTLDRATFVPLFREQGLVHHLRHISKSSSEMENFSTFHGHSGVSSHPVTMEELIKNVSERTRSL